MHTIIEHGARLALVLGALALVQCSGKANEQSPSNSVDTSSAGAGDTSQAGSGDTSQAGSGDTSQAGSGDTSQAGSGGTSQAGGGDTSQAGSGGTSQAGSGGQAACGGARSAAVRRPTPAVCAASVDIVVADAGSCGNDTNCTANSEAPYCFHGQCGPDQCLSDADCASGEACRCDDGGNSELGNICVPAQCYTDADCGANGACSPSFNSYCGSLSGYYCHSSDDTCNSDSDCCPSTSNCQYQPALGHFTCSAPIVCQG